MGGTSSNDQSLQLADMTLNQINLDQIFDNNKTIFDEDFSIIKGSSSKN